MAASAISGFHRDEEGDWVADLACGHGQHVRHKPPWKSRPWVQSEEGRASQLGAELECVLCEMPRLPEGVHAYKQTPVFDETSIPAGLKRAHTTKDATWARIVVEEGKLQYTLEDGSGSWVLRPGVLGFVAPGVAHRVEPVGAVRFHVEFLREEA